MIDISRPYDTWALELQHYWIVLYCAAFYKCIETSNQCQLTVTVTVAIKWLEVPVGSGALHTALRRNNWTETVPFIPCTHTWLYEVPWRVINKGVW